MSSVRQAIIENLIDRLQDMSIANGYAYDYNFIDSWYLTEVQQSQLPAVILFDTISEVIEPYTFETTNRRMEVIIAIVAKGQASDDDVRKMMADVHKCVGDDIYCGGLATEIRPVSDSITMGMKDTVIGDMQCTFHVFYSEASWNMHQVI